MAAGLRPTAFAWVLDRFYHTATEVLVAAVSSSPAPPSFRIELV
jgi:hypothetical protein